MSNNKMIKKIEELTEEIEVLYDETNRGHRGYSSVTSALRDAMRDMKRAVYHLQRMDGKHPEPPRQEFEEKKFDRAWGSDLEQSHESFGVISVSRVTGMRRLVGSMLDASPAHMNVVIRRATRLIDERLHTERYHATWPPLVELSMSMNQWAEFISSPGHGDGTPCTIEVHDGVDMAPVPEEVKSPLATISEQVHKESLYHRNEGQKEFDAAITAIRKGIEGTKMTKKAQAELLKLVDGVRSCESAPRATADWGIRRIAEATEEAKTSAKVEIEALIGNKIVQMGLEQAKTGGLGNLLPEGKKEEDK